MSDCVSIPLVGEISQEGILLRLPPGHQAVPFVLTATAIDALEAGPYDEDEWENDDDDFDDYEDYDEFDWEDDDVIPEDTPVFADLSELEAPARTHDPDWGLPLCLVCGEILDADGYCPNCEAVYPYPDDAQDGEG